LSSGKKERRSRKFWALGSSFAGRKRASFVAALPGRGNDVRRRRRINKSDHGRSRPLATLCAAQQLRTGPSYPILSYETEREQAALKDMRIMILREIVHTGFNPRVAPAAGASIGGDVAAHFAGGARICV
jgi:hypothetical protein